MPRPRTLETSSQMGGPQVSQSYDWLRLSYLVSLGSQYLAN